MVTDIWVPDTERTEIQSGMLLIYSTPQCLDIGIRWIARRPKQTRLGETVAHVMWLAVGPESQ